MEINYVCLFLISLNFHPLKIEPLRISIPLICSNGKKEGNDVDVLIYYSNAIKSCLIPLLEEDPACDPVLLLPQFKQSTIEDLKQLLTTGQITLNNEDKDNLFQLEESLDCSMEFKMDTIQFELQDHQCTLCLRGYTYKCIL